MVFQGKEADFGRLGTLGCPFGPSPAVGWVLCPMEVLGGSLWVCLECWAEGGRLLLTRSFGKRLSPAPGAEPAPCGSPVAARGYATPGGAVGTLVGLEPSRCCHGSPSVAPRAPQTPARVRGSAGKGCTALNPFFLNSSVQRGRREGWGCFPGLEAVGKSILPVFLRPPSQQG